MNSLALQNVLIFLKFLDDKKWWNKSGPSLKPTKASKTIDVEITAYGLLSLLEDQKYTESLPYFKWLLSQRNERGGFEGTQDTVVGLQALAKFAERISAKDSNVQIAIKTNATSETDINVTSQNALVLQTVEVSTVNRLLKFFDTLLNQ